MAKKDNFTGKGFSRRQFLSGATALALGSGLRATTMSAQPQQRSTTDGRDLALINGKIHMMDASNRVVSQVLIRREIP